MKTSILRPTSATRSFLKGTAASILLLSALSSCNKEESTEIEYTPSSSVAVNSFSLKADEKVAANLDSVFFSIDLNAGVIANADSLPKGTEITKLIPVIGVPSSVSSATITMTGGKVREGEVDYKKNPSDSIDFSGRVVLRLVAEDGKSARSYLLKVNVHTADPDTLAWDRLAIASLPSRMAGPKAQRTVKYHDAAYSLIEESDGSYTISSSKAPAADNWEKQQASLPSASRIETLTSTDDALYILSEDGSLHTSADGLTWSDTGADWTAIVGGYGKSLLGVRNTSAGAVHTAWPATSGIAESPLEADFPVKGYSDMGLFSSKWSLLPTGFITGGVTASGQPCAATWAFDGSRWASIADNPAPALTGATLVPYYTYASTSTSWVKTEYAVWLLIGGSLSDGKPNKEVWITYDNGANWRKADQWMQLPDHIAWRSDASAVVLPADKQADLNNGWSFVQPRRPSPAMRLKASVSDDIVSWQCPYIYLFGGIDADGKLLDSVMRGVIVRMEFTPLI